MSERGDPKKILLRRLCKDYIWYRLMGASTLEGIKMAEEFRSECHIAIMTLLDDIGHSGSMSSIFHHLDDLGFPTDYSEIIDHNQWDRIAQTVGNNAYKKLAEGFYPQQGVTSE